MDNDDSLKTQVLSRMINTKDLERLSLSELLQLREVLEEAGARHLLWKQAMSKVNYRIQRVDKKERPRPKTMVVPEHRIRRKL